MFAAVTATYIKPPAEKGLLAHVQYLRELLDLHVLHALMWMETRDMIADGLQVGIRRMYEAYRLLYAFKYLVSGPLCV